MWQFAKSKKHLKSLVQTTWGPESGHSTPGDSKDIVNLVGVFCENVTRNCSDCKHMMKGFEGDRACGHPHSGEHLYKIGHVSGQYHYPPPKWCPRRGGE